MRLSADVKEKRLLDRWQRYVEIESGSHFSEGLAAMSDVLSGDLEEAGFDVQVWGQSEAGVPHIIAEREGSAPGQIILLGHVDTVWPPGTLREIPFRIEDGKAFGPGVADMKGGLAVMIESLLVSHSSSGSSVRVVITSDEELGTPSGRDVVERQSKDADFVLVFEAGRPGGHFVDERRGIAVYRLNIAGKTAHAGNDPENGINAVDELAHQLLALAGMRDLERDVYVMAGVVEGGTARQVVPEYASALIDVRAGSRTELDRVKGQIESLPSMTNVEGVHVTVEGGETRPPFESVPGTDRVRRIVESIASEFGYQATFVGAGGGSDGNFTSALGIPTIDSFGPVGHRLCSKAEYAEVESAFVRASIAGELLSRPIH